jgi:outer membrane protein TolC
MAPACVPVQRLGRECNRRRAAETALREANAENDALRQELADTQAQLAAARARLADLSGFDPGVHGMLRPTSRGGLPA